MSTGDGHRLELGIAGLEWIAEIGSGGFGVVHRARDEAHGRDVAVKTLHGSSDPDSRRRFDRERRLMGSLSSHRNIVSIHTSGYTDRGIPYLVMELVPGGSLADRLARGPLDVAGTVEIGLRLGDALCAAHDAGVLHLDIKPENVLIDAKGEPLLTDFGIAASVSEVALRKSIAATPSYSAPEVIDGFSVDERTDLYSLAATLFSCLTARSPYERDADDGVLAMLTRLAGEPVPRIDDPAVPAALSDLLATAMAKDPNDRPPSMRVFVDQLGAIDLTAVPSRPRDPSRGVPTLILAPGEDVPPRAHFVSSPTTAAGTTTPRTAPVPSAARGAGSAPPLAGPAERPSSGPSQLRTRAIGIGVALAALVVIVVGSLLVANRSGNSDRPPGFEPAVAAAATVSESPPPASVIPATGAGQTAQPVPSPTAPSTTGADTTPRVFDPQWALGRTADFRPLSPVDAVPSGSPMICLFWDYEGIPAGEPFEVRWFVDGESQGRRGIDRGTTSDIPGFFACFENADGMPDGVYELEWWVADELIFGESVFVGGDHPLVAVTIINDSPQELCSVQFSPTAALNLGLNDLDRNVQPGAQTVIPLPAGTYAVTVTDCTGAVRFEDDAGTELFDGITLTIA